MIKNNLRNESHEFYECEDGAESLAAYRQFLPDWVLMDWEMKIVSGLTAARLILREFPSAQILIIEALQANLYRLNFDLTLVEALRKVSELSLPL